MKLRDLESVDMIIRSVPRWLRRELKMLAAKEEKAMNTLIIELMKREVAEKSNPSI